jgi:hypothetical protein
MFFWGEEFHKKLEYNDLCNLAVVFRIEAGID